MFKYPTFVTYFWFCLPVKMPKPLMGRDFVTQRSWLGTNEEYMIVNHSINHKVIHYDFRFPVMFFEVLIKLLCNSFSKIIANV